MAAFHRIVVDIIHVPGVVGVAADGMLPEAPLPDRPLPASDARTRTALGGRNGADKADLDRLDPVGEGCVTLGQGDDAVHVLGQPPQASIAKDRSRRVRRTTSRRTSVCRMSRSERRCSRLMVKK